MRVLVAPDNFGSSLSAASAAEAIARGWSHTDPSATIICCPLADGGPGFVDVIHANLAGDLLAATVTGPWGAPGPRVPATIARVGSTAYVECAQACGLHLVPTARRSVRTATSYGVGELIRAAIDSGADTVVVGIGGTACNDGGAGLLAALGATADVALDQGGAAVKGVTTVDIEAVEDLVAGIRLVVATDVDNPLLGLTGATKEYGPQKGASESDVFELDAALADLAAALGKDRAGKNPAIARGSGAGGGIGFALLRIGAERVAGIDTVFDAVGFADACATADLVITGEGRFDWSSMRGKVVSGVAARAMATLKPCVVIAGDVVVGRREYSAIGVSSAYSCREVAGTVEQALAEPYDTLEAAAARVARTWSRRIG